MEFKIVGRLFATEIILICLFPILLFTMHDVDITINLSESLSREDLFGYIQSFRSWRRTTIFKSLIKKAMMNPFKIPEVTLFFVEKMKDRVKRWSLARKPAH